MTDDGAALLLAILTDPGDDTRRLAYADWLDENGEDAECPKCKGNWENRTLTPTLRRIQGITPMCDTCFNAGRISDGRAERAEFIRVQVELARNRWYVCKQKRMAGVWPKSEIARANELEGREWELWGSYPDTNDMRAAIRRECPPLESWVVLPDSLVSGRENVDSIASVSRGFVSSLHCTAAAFMTHARAIFEAQPVTDVRLTDKDPDFPFGGNPGWHRDQGLNEADDIPPELFRVMKEQKMFEEDSDWLWAESPDLARAALSAACVQYGRALAGLPPLPTGSRTATEVVG